MPPRQAEIILAALKPELTGVGRRTEVRVERAGLGVSVDIRVSISMYRVVGSER